MAGNQIHCPSTAEVKNLKPDDYRTVWHRLYRGKMTFDLLQNVNGAENSGQFVALLLV